MTKSSFNVFRTKLRADDSDLCEERERELDLIAGTAQPKTVTVSTGKLVRLLIDAAQQERAWLNDFADDPVRIDADFYDVLLAYQQMQQRAA
jgi:hypothetical protein